MRKSLYAILLFLSVSTLILAQGRGGGHGNRSRMKNIAVGEANNVWGVTTDERLMHWDGTAWDEPTDGRLSQVDVGADGAVWGVSSDGSVFRLDGKKWVNVPGIVLKQITVGNFSVVWGVNEANEIFQWTGTAFTQPFPTARMKQVDAAGDGSVWAVSANDKVFKLRGKTWELQPGSALLKQVSVGSRSAVWGVNAENQVFQYSAGAWQQPVPTMRLSSIDVGSDGTRYGVNAENQVWKWDGAAWVEVKPGRKEDSPLPDVQVASPNPGVTVFADANFTGPSKIITADWDYGMDGTWNDRISSIRIPAGYKIQVFVDRGAGASMIMTSDWTVTPTELKFNDNISSIKILTYPQIPPPDIQVVNPIPAITLFADANFNGPSKTISADWDYGMDAQWNDRISSIRIPAGYKIEVFENRWTGVSMIMTSDWTVSPSDLRFNDKISSIKILSFPQPPPPVVYVAPVVVAPAVIPAPPVVVLPPPPAAYTPNNPGYTIYEAVGFNGASSKLYGDWNADMAPEWNDKISSIRIPAGYTIEVYEHTNFQGASMRLTGDWSVTNANIKFNDFISSMRVVEYPGIGPVALTPVVIPATVNAPAVNTSPSYTIFADGGFHGASTTLYGDWDASMAPQWNDRISSIRVPQGYVVEVFEHANFQGLSMKLTSDWNVSPTTMKFNDFISSIKVYPVPTKKMGLTSRPVITQQVVNAAPVSTEYVVKALHTEYAPEESIIVDFSGFKGTGGEWVNVVPSSKPDTEWGNYQYTRGASGRLTFPGLNLKTGEYEIRSYRGGQDFTVMGRFRFTIR